MAATWGEAWLLTAGLTWLKDNYGFDWVIRAMSWNQTKFMATAAVCGSLVTLTFVAFLVHFIRFLVQWDRTRSPQPVGSLLKATGPDAA